MADPVRSDTFDKLRQVLVGLRRRIRRYVLIEGISLTVCVLGTLFWVSLLLEWGYFRLSNFEPPIALRAILIIGGIALTVGTAGVWVISRLLRNMQLRSLAMVLERRFPQLDDRLILAVETSESPDEATTRMNRILTDRAIGEVVDLLPTLRIGDVFDALPLRRAALAALVLIASIAVFGATNADAMSTWWRAFVGFEDAYRMRATRLTTSAVLPPDERVVRLNPESPLKHPRGGDLSLLIEVSDTPRPDGAEWVIPEQVTVYSRDGRGASSVVPAVQVGETQFRVVIEEVVDDLRLWVSGNDYTDRVPYVVQIVDAPRMDSAALAILYPAYMQRNRQDEDGGPIPDATPLTGPAVEIPVESYFDFEITFNKPMLNARVRFGGDELTIGDFRDSTGDAERSFRAAYVVEGIEGEPPTRTLLEENWARGLWDETRTRLTLPLLVTDAARGVISEPPEGRPGPVGQPLFAVPPDVLMRLWVEDFDEIATVEPVRIELRAIPDLPPEINTRPTGIGGLITRTAVIPVAGQVRDDFGIRDAQFEYQLQAKSAPDDAPQAGWIPRTLRRPPSGLPTVFELGRSDDEEYEWLDTAPLDLELGDVLSVVVIAEDANDLIGPQVTRGEVFQFRVVTAEELLGVLFNAELNQRKTFEQVIEEIEDVRTDLSGAIENATKVSTLRESGDRDELRTAVLAVRRSADRAYAELSQNRQSTATIADEFRQIFQQLVNNRIHTEAQLERIDSRILEPLDMLVDNSFPAATDSVAEIRRADRETRPVEPYLRRSIDQVEDMLRTMREVLDEMQSLADMQEALQELSSIYKDLSDVKAKTKEEQKRDILNNLGGGLFE
ncbi:hypothetical protein [Stratiformator vulcanicus]|uniref:Uncharacterized protein n=1 Tax=Stratiformator vulcanicus TaxID=2527980 RepID=A0A517R2N6_9PLAN|nr:hypothetical protein [Stratiformator vulcanicus]QDT38128.1 hypothetical protein Pan189_25180 [Stratiformator vulcanicus]